MKKHQSGFTLIEIAIVLLIIGLLLGGVMKGQALINSARVRAIANDLSGIEAAWVSFRDRYRSLPGDFPRASTHITATLADVSYSAENPAKIAHLNTDCGPLATTLTPLMTTNIVTTEFME